MSFYGLSMIFYVLDTDHLSLYQRSHPQVCDRIRAARQNGIVLKTTVVTVEEQYAGRLAQIRKSQTPEALIAAYDRLKVNFSLFSQLDILEYNRTADEHFRQFRSQRVRIGTQGLRIASIAIAHGGIILTRNQKDFEQVPGLTIEDWSF
jgi:tRNA(fMet)-specific endonuclease VapC